MAATPILKAFRLTMQWPTFGPFLFCAHHDDHYPKGRPDMSPDASLEGRMLGSDFAPELPWRMYHGESVPGFPAHPHRGFETITIVRDGYVDHSDSLGAAARFGHGDVQWLTTGAGVVHSEMFPLVHTDKENRTELFQIWLNLPARSKMEPAHFQMRWAETLPNSTYVDENGAKTHAVHITGPALFEGTELDREPLPTPPASWAADPNNHVRVVTLKMDANAKMTLPPLEKGIARALYYFVGEDWSLNGDKLPSKAGVLLDPERAVEVVNGDKPAELLVLEGRPIDEPVVQHGPFVMNTAEEIHQTMRDYHQTQFGGWPWPSQAPAHERTRGRFAQYADGRVEEPQ